MVIVYRPIRGGLVESMKELKSFKTFTELFIYVSRLYDYDIKSLSICVYDLNPDYRIFWNETCYLLHNGNVIGFVGTQS